MVCFGSFFQSGPVFHYIENATCFTIFPCVSLGTYAHIAVLLVMCSTLSIVLTRPTDAWRLKRKENDLFRQGIVKRKKWISNSMIFPKIYQGTILYDKICICWRNLQLPSHFADRCICQIGNSKVFFSTYSNFYFSNNSSFSKIYFGFIGTSI